MNDGFCDVCSHSEDAPCHRPESTGGEKDALAGGWEKTFVETFYVYNLLKNTPAGAEKEAIAFIRSVAAKEREEVRKEALARVREIAISFSDDLPLSNRWSETSEEGYRKNDAVEDNETGRNPVVREIRKLTIHLLSELSKLTEEEKL